MCVAHSVHADTLPAVTLELFGAFTYIFCGAVLLITEVAAVGMFVALAAAMDTGTVTTLKLILATSRTSAVDLV